MLHYVYHVVADIVVLLLEQVEYDLSELFWRKIAACCIWKQCWWEQWDQTNAVKLQTRKPKQWVTGKLQSVVILIFRFVTASNHFHINVVNWTIVNPLVKETRTPIVPWIPIFEDKKITLFGTRAKKFFLFSLKNVIKIYSSIKVILYLWTDVFLGLWPLHKIKFIYGHSQKKGKYYLPCITLSEIQHGGCLECYMFLIKGTGD